MKALVHAEDSKRLEVARALEEEARPANRLSASPCSRRRKVFHREPNEGLPSASWAEVSRYWELTRMTLRSSGGRPRVKHPIFYIFEGMFECFIYANVSCYYSINLNGV